MDDDRYYSRGNFGFSARGGQNQHAPSSSSSVQPRVTQYDRPQYDSYTLSSAHPESSRHAQQHYHQKSAQVYSQQQREPEWAYDPGAPSRSPPSALDGGHQMSYRARADVQAPAAPSLPNRSEWLVLPSVSHALGMYGDTRRQEPRFSLVIRQQPRRGLAIGNSQMSLRTARSVSIDPPPVCELLIDRSGDEQLLSLPEVFIRAQLVRGDSPTDECLPDARRIETLVGDTLQSPFNSRIDTREDQSFFVFKELGVRNRGIYRLRFDLFDRVGLRIFKIASVYSDAFDVQERRKHPGLSASSALMDALVDRGMKYKLRKANDKSNPKKRKSPEDFYYGDERSVNAAAHRRQSYAAGEYDAASRYRYSTTSSSSRSPYADGAPQQQSQQQHQLIRPVPHRAHSGERIHGFSTSTSDMLPPLNAIASTQLGGPRLSPPSRVDKPPQLPSLSRLGVAPAPRAYTSHLPPHPQLHNSRSPWSQPQEEEFHHETNPSGTAARAPHSDRYLSPHTSEMDRTRPSLEFRSSSSVATSNSTGQASSTTPSSSTTEQTPFHFNKPDSNPGSGHLEGGSGRKTTGRLSGELAPSSASSSTSSPGSTQRPTLPPISSLYAASTAARRPSAVQQEGYFTSLHSPPAQRSPRH